MRARYRYLTVVVVALLGGSSCASSTSPSNASLDGQWTSGLALSGLVFGFDLKWAGPVVTGSGGYNVLENTNACSGDSLGLTGMGSVRLVATRGAANSLKGALQFDTGLRAPFSGTLESSGNGSGDIEGSFIKPDGTSCPWGLSEGLVP